MIHIAIFLHDAGVSNNLHSIVKHYLAHYKWSLFCLKDSPAWKIFTSSQLNINIVEIDNNTNLNNQLLASNPDIFLTGTGWQNKLHLEFIQIAKKLGIPSVATLEHWTNYKERFEYPNKNLENMLPEYITVNDSHGYKIAKNLNYKKLIKLKFYNLLHDINRFKKQKHIESEGLLFISEPTKDVALKTYQDENYWGFNEFDICEDICENIKIFSTNKLTIRLHPSDKVGKYDYLQHKYPQLELSIENPYQNPLIDSLSQHKTIIGIDGIVLYEAMVLGKLSISFIPSSKRKCEVPIFAQNCVTSLQNLQLSSLKKEDQTKKAESFGISFANLINKVIQES